MNRREFLKIAAYTAGSLWAAHALPSWAIPGQTLQRRGRSRKVAVLGAGLAGLVSAYRLNQAGHDVIVLEAQLHPGGRVHTIREGLSDDLYAEAGAGRIPSTHSVTLEWVRFFGLELEPFWPTRLSNLTLLRRQRVKTPVGQPIDTTHVPLQLTAEERRIGLSGLEEHYYGTLMRRIGGMIDPNWPADIRQLADISLRDYLRSLGASDDATHYLSMGFQHTAALDFIRDSLSHAAPSFSKIKGGNDLLPRALAAQISNLISYGSAVRHIGHDAERVRITYLQSGLQRQLEADAVICTIPFGVLKHIEVTPGWSPVKKKAIDNLSYGAVVRTTYQTRRRYWEDEGLNGFGTSDADFEVWSPTFGRPGKRGLLQAYVYEDAARKLTALDEARRDQLMLEQMEQVHPGLRQNVEGMVTKCWDLDPWQRGAYVVYWPGQLSLYPLVCAREGRIWFAGEHASGWPGWMQGAIESGSKAAKKINEATDL